MPRKKTIKIAVTDEEAAQFEEIAKDAGLKTAAWIRNAAIVQRRITLARQSQDIDF